MPIQLNDTPFSFHCQAEVSDGYLRYTGTFTRTIPFVPEQDESELIIKDIEQIGQQIKCRIAVAALEAVDRRNIKKTVS
ncbi:MAG: hypothetical protein LBE12_02905 [Planctomycetaceae bacterium]|nr:hypothetical protein [Planctomycetaceae bacterium]